MKNIVMVVSIMTLLFFAGCLSCPPCPRENINVPAIVHPSLPVMLIPFEKGELDKTDEERGYKIYTDEELKELQEKLSAPEDPGGREDTTGLIKTKN